MAANAVPFRSTIFYTTAGVPAGAGSVLTVGANGTQNFTSNLALNTLTASTISMQSTTIALGQSTNQRYTNFTNGSFSSTLMTSTLTSYNSLSTVTKVSMSQDGRLQYALQSVPSTLSYYQLARSSDTGVTWNTLNTSTMGLPQGSLAYQSTVSGYPTYTNISQSATGQYALAATSGGQLYVSNNANSATPVYTPANVGGAPYAYLPMDSLPITDMMGNTTITVTGSAPLVAGKVGTSAINLANTAGGTATNYVRGTWTGAANFTVSFWFNTPNSNTNQILVGAYNGQFNIVTSSSVLYLFIPSSLTTAVLAVTGPTILNNTWYNVTGIFQTGSACSLYVNGTFYGSYTNSGALPPCTQFCLGTYGNGAVSNAFNGYIDDFRLYNFAAPNVVPPYIYLPLDGNVVDAMGNVSAANLTATGGPAYVQGVVGTQAIYLANTVKDTPVHYITSTWTYVSTFSVSFWFNMQTVPSGQVCLFGMSNASSFSFQIAVDTGAIYINTLASDSTYQTTAAAPISANTWYYVTAIYQQTGSIILYLNNVLISSITAKAMLNTPNRLRIGAYPHSTGAGLNGYIDDFRIYNYAITPSPIAPMNWSHTAVSGTGQYMMAAAANGGVFCSTNYGASWSQLTASQISSIVGTGNAAKTLMGPLIQPNNAAATSATWSANGATWTVTASSNYTGYNPYKAFDNSIVVSSASWNTATLSYTSAGNSSGYYTTIQGIGSIQGEWLQIQSSVPLVMYSYQFSLGGGALQFPNTFYIAGSNDATTWFPIQRSIGVAQASSNAWNIIPGTIILSVSGSQTFGSSTLTTTAYSTTTNAYTYFRLIGTNNYSGSSSYLEIGEWLINFATPMPLLTAPATAPSMATSAVTVSPQMMNMTAPNATTTWSTPNGVTWTASATTTYTLNSPINYPGLAFNGVISGATTFSWASGNANYVNGVAQTTNTNMSAVNSTSGTINIKGEALQLQASVPLIMNSYSYAASTYSYAPKTYYILGSNDGITWYNLHSASTPTNPFGTTNTIPLTTYITVNYTGTQPVISSGGSTTTTTAATQYSTNAYTYFRIIADNVYSGTIFELAEFYANFTAYTPNPVNALAITNGGQTQLVAATGTTMPNSTAATSNSWTANGVNWTASASTTYGGYSPYGAFNIMGTFPTWNSGTFYNGATGAYTASTPVSTAITGQSAQTGEYLQLQSSVPLILYSYSITTGGWWQMPKTYWIVGSNDGSTWYPIQSGTFAANPYNTNFGSSSNYIIANNASAQAFVGQVSTTVTTVTYAPYTTQAYIYFRMIYPSMWGNSGGTNAPNNDGISIGELLLNFQSGSTYLSTNYGSTWSTAITAPTNAPFLATSGNGTYILTGSGQIATLYNNGSALGGSALQAFSYTIPTLTGINANINCASISSTGQNMVILTQGTTNNVFYSTNFGATFTGMTVGNAAMTSCAMSTDGNEIMVSNASNVYTLNRNTQGYSITMGNQSGLTNQGQNSIAIGNLAGVTNQSANSIILNASGSTLDAYNPGFFVSPVLPHATSTQTSVNLLGYGADNQVVQSGLTVLSNGYTGIGTAAFGAYLQVYNSNAAFTSGPTVHIGDGQTDMGNYGMLQLVRANNGADNKAHISFIKNGLWIFGMGYYPGTSVATFGLVPSGSMATNTGLWMSTGGYVGIGTTGPSALIHIYGSSTTGDRNSSLRVSTQRAGLYLNSLGTSGTNWNIWSALSGESCPAGSLAFFDDTNNSFRMVIDNTGRVGIGVASPTYQLTLSTDSAAKLSTTTWTTTSDERIKENIVLADINRCIEIIRAVPLKHYRWKDEVYTNEQVKDRSKLGWIAQDVKKVFPKAVGTYRLTYNQVYEDVVNDSGLTEKKLVSEDVIEDCLDLNVDQLYAVMYGAIQKLVTENDSKAETLSAQAEKIASLESQLAAQTEQLAAQTSQLTSQTSQLTEVLSRLAALESKS